MAKVEKDLQVLLLIYFCLLATAFFFVAFSHFCSPPFGGFMIPGGMLIGIAQPCIFGFFSVAHVRSLGLAYVRVDILECDLKNANELYKYSLFHIKRGNKNILNTSLNPVKHIVPFLNALSLLW